MSNNKVSHISASSIWAFKSCPQRFRLGYVEGIREAIEPQPLRMGTAWHKGLEVLETPAGETFLADANTPITVTDENRLELSVEAATNVYATIPDWADATKWAVEREIVANALIAYNQLYPLATSEYETVATELQFSLPLVNPETEHATQNFRRVGKIDRIIRHKVSGRLLIQENKSTSQPIDSDSEYWLRLRKDTQSKFYIVAVRDMNFTGGQVSGLLHDVFHKPQISPKKLTQAESAEFVKTGDYCGQKFVIQTGTQAETTSGPALWIEVDGMKVDYELGAEPKIKKDGSQAPRPFSIQETPGMFGARFFQDMTQQPEKYFARKEIPFTDDELEDFRYQIWALQKTIAEMVNTGHWYENEHQCEATGSFKCPYRQICYNNVQCCDGTTTPPGFVRLRSTEAAG